MTPLEIEILLHYHYSPHDYRDLGAPAIKEAIERFCKNGILTEWSNRTPRFYKNDEAMDLYIEAVCSVPLPNRKWVIENKTQHL